MVVLGQNTLDLIMCSLISVVSTYTQEHFKGLCWVRKHSPPGARLEQPVELTWGFLTMYTRLTALGPLGRKGHWGGEEGLGRCYMRTVGAMVKMEQRG